MTSLFHSHLKRYSEPELLKTDLVVCLPVGAGSRQEGAMMRCLYAETKSWW